MLKNRLIPIVLLKGDRVVQSYGFKTHLPIGKLEAVVEFLTNWDVDEIILLDIDASRQNRAINLDVVRSVARNSMIPLTIGGGINNIKFLDAVLNSGGDKVSLNTVLHTNPNLITEIASKYGSQFVVASIDVKLGLAGYETYLSGNGKLLSEHPAETAKRVESLGAGEILVNSVDRDGTGRGYDIDLLKCISNAVDIPVIACGGVGKFTHLIDGITAGGCQAAGASNIFYHTELSTVAAKAVLRDHRVNVRLDTAVQYKNFRFDELDRPI